MTNFPDGLYTQTCGNITLPGIKRNEKLINPRCVEKRRGMYHMVCGIRRCTKINNCLRKSRTVITTTKEEALCTDLLLHVSYMNWWREIICEKTWEPLHKAGHALISTSCHALYSFRLQRDSNHDFCDCQWLHSSVVSSGRVFAPESQKSWVRILMEPEFFFQAFISTA